MNELKIEFKDDQAEQFLKDNIQADSRQPNRASKKSTKSPNDPNQKSDYHKMEIKIRDTMKIKTNPKYKCVDENSEEDVDDT